MISIRLSQVRQPVGSESDLEAVAARILKIKREQVSGVKILKKSIDARDKTNVFYVLTLDVTACIQKLPRVKNAEIIITSPPEVIISKPRKTRPVVVGSGPAGMFAALTLCRAGFRPIILERGKPVEEREKDVSLFRGTGILNPESNIQFGEGGAGTFSDGKLTTGIGGGFTKTVIDEFISAGAPGEIAFLAKPHIGTDMLIRVVGNLRRKIESMGAEYRFEHKFTGFSAENGKLTAVKAVFGGEETVIPAEHLILAIGHSARDTFEVLLENGIHMRPKPFAVGVRIEHSQDMISVSQFGRFARFLPAADYKMNTRLNDRGVFTFCMCPGGEVVAASSEKNRLCVNGMSRFARNGVNANSALLVNVSPADFRDESVLSGMYFQQMLEKSAFELGGGGYRAPVSLVGDFLENRCPREIGSVEPSYRPGYELVDLRECLDGFIVEALKFGIRDMDKKLSGFMKYDSVLTAVESRSSSPVWISRDEARLSNIHGIIPCGEGAGYAGGIMSAAVDGIKCALTLTEA